MMPLVRAAMLAAGSSLAASIVAKTTISTMVGLIAVRAARRNRAAVRHTLLAAAFGVLLLLPIASIVSPPIRIAVPAAPQERILPAAEAATGMTASGAPAPASDDTASAVPLLERLSPSSLLFAAWIGGAALFLLPVVMGLWQLRSLRRSALPWRHGQSVVDSLALAAGIHRRVEVLLHGEVPGPMTSGILHPSIMLSRDAQEWDPEDLNRAIVHELEHIRRGDWLTHCLARAVCAVYWFHPLVWIAWRKLVLEAERSCDDAVLASSESTAYADQLVGLARRLSLAPKSPLLAMANRTDLATRVHAVLDSRLPRGRAGFPVALACAAAAVLVLAISPLRIVAAAQSAGTDMAAAGMPQESINTMLIQEDVTVLDRNGKSIEGLKAGDFVVTEDGAPQSINVFEFQMVAPRDTVPSYYILGYYTRKSDADGSLRRVKITLKADPTARLDYRPSYYASSQITSANREVPGGSGQPGVTRPVVLHKVEPEYSEPARKAKYQGTLLLRVAVDPAGRATHIQVQRSLDLGLDEKGIEAIRQWRFKPGMKDGKPVTAQIGVEMNFLLR